MLSLMVNVAARVAGGARYMVAWFFFIFYFIFFIFTFYILTFSLMCFYFFFIFVLFCCSTIIFTSRARSLFHQPDLFDKPRVHKAALRHLHEHMFVVFCELLAPWCAPMVSALRATENTVSSSALLTELTRQYTAPSCATRIIPWDCAPMPARRAIESSPSVTLGARGPATRRGHVGHVAFSPDLFGRATCPQGRTAAPT